MVWNYTQLKHFEEKHTLNKKLFSRSYIYEMLMYIPRLSRPPKKPKVKTDVELTDIEPKAEPISIKIQEDVKKYYTAFFEIYKYEDFKVLFPKTSHIDQPIRSLAVDIYKNYTNNANNHFYKYLKRIVKARLYLEGKTFSHSCMIDLITNMKLTDPILMDIRKKYMFGNKRFSSIPDFKYYLKSNTVDAYPYMFSIVKELQELRIANEESTKYNYKDKEKNNRQVKFKSHLFKKFQVFPQKRDLFNNYINLDYVTISEIITGSTKQVNTVSSTTNTPSLTTNTSSSTTVVGRTNILKANEGRKRANAFKVWNTYFDLLGNKRFRKKNYEFNYLIQTDGFGASVSFHKHVKTSSIKESTEIPKIEDHLDEIKVDKDKKIIEKLGVGDGGRHNILQILSNQQDPNFKIIKNEINSLPLEKNKHKKKYKKHPLKNFQRKKKNRKKNRKKNKTKDIKSTEVDGRYTMAERNHHLRRDFYRKRVEKIMRKDGIKKWTTEGRNSLTVDEYTDYIKLYIPYIIKNIDKYQKIDYAKIKFKKYQLTQRENERMLNKIICIVKGIQHQILPKQLEKDIVICLGDWDGCNELKGLEATPNKTVINLICKRVKRVYTVNEYNTSKMHRSGNELTTYTNAEGEKMRSVSYYKNTKDPSSKIAAYVNRDKNACRNMLDKIKSLVAGKGCPSIMKRPEVTTKPLSLKLQAN
jgi:hypothetical protein